MAGQQYFILIPPGITNIQYKLTKLISIKTLFPVLSPIFTHETKKEGVLGKKMKS
jgi:hypothetical protein